MRKTPTTCPDVAARYFPPSFRVNCQVLEKHYDAQGCAELALNVLRQAIEPKYVHRFFTPKKAADHRYVFAGTAFVGLVCAVYEIDENLCNKKILETANRLKYGGKTESQDDEASGITLGKT